MFEAVTDLTPVAVLADRSRDAMSCPMIAHLEPHGVFLVTDNRRRLTARVLRDYDIVTIVGHGATPYSKAERRALVEFVRRGGALVLAASAGAFERESGCSAGRLAVNGVAREFGFAFETTAGYPATHEYLYHHARREDLELTAAGKEVGLALGETQVWFPGPISVPPRATVLLRAKQGHTPFAARARVGRGTVLVWGDIGLFASGWTSFPSTLHLAAVAPRRRTAAVRPPVLRDVPREQIEDGLFSVRFSPFGRKRAGRILELAQSVYREVCREIRPPGKPKRIILRVEPGTGGRGDWGYPDEYRLLVGADNDDVGAIVDMVRTFAFRLLGSWWKSQRHVPFLHSAARFITIRVLERLGFPEDAEIVSALTEGGRPIDLATWYSQDMHPPRRVLRFFQDAETALGKGTFRKFCRALPKKKPFGDLAARYHGALDGIAFHLARAVGPRAFDWIESEGPTLRRVPPGEPGSDALAKKITRALSAAFADEAAPASERVNAAYALADRLAKKKTRAASLARSAGGENPSRAIPAALALARSRDERGRAGLVRWAGTGHAVAILLAVSECGAESFADRLVLAAERSDTRFQLATGQALDRIGDKRSKRFSFARLPGCSFRHWENGTQRIYALIDGRAAALTQTGPVWDPRGAGAAVSRNYVYWVHTGGLDRRLGLARATVTEALRHRHAKLCSEVALDAMSDYFAHALYRDLGMVDSATYRSFDKKPEARPCRPPRGVCIRPGMAEDLGAANALARRAQESLPNPIPRLSDWPGVDVALVAVEKKKIIGVLAFTGTQLLAFAVDDRIEKKGRREAIASALLAAADREQHARKAKGLSTKTWLPIGGAFHETALQKAGYVRTTFKMLEQSMLVSLCGQLREMRPLLQKRLTDGKEVRDWSGTIQIESRGHRAVLVIEKRRLRVEPGPVGRPSIRMKGNEETIIRVIRGLASPFDEHNQMRLEIRPAMSGPVRKLLDKIFPRLTPL
jgi:hypothetical protein